MHQEKKKPARVRSVLAAYGKTASSYPLLLVMAVIGAIVVQAANVIAPLYLRQFINYLSGGQAQSDIIASLLLTLFLFAGVNIIGWAGQRIRQIATMRVEARVMSDLYKNALGSLLRHSHEFFISNFTGTLTRRVTRYARSFEQVFDNVIFNFFPAILFTGGVTAVLWQKSAYLGAGLLVWTMLFIYIQYKTIAWLQPIRAKRVEKDSLITGTLSDAVLNHSTITTFAAIGHELNIFSAGVNEWYEATKRSWDANHWVDTIQEILAIIIEVALLAGAVFLWQRGLVTVGDFVLIQIYILGLFNQIWNIGRNMRQLYDAFADATEMLDIMELPHGIQDVSGAPELHVQNGAITFNHVRFEYHDSHSVLKDFNLTVSPHEKIALIGSSGAGKTTIAKLLLRLYDVTGGEVTIDGQDIGNVTQESLRRAIAFVPQEPMLFHRSLMDNIRYGRQGATDEEVIESAKQAHCHEFISQYSEGFQTLVGERGVKLSGGERQRVAIARAILKNAPILLLDEATSSLDSESEKLIQDALIHLMKGKTVIAIAHRLSTVMKMDRLIVMEKGKVILTGTHDEFLAHESNLYKKLWEIQAGGFINPN
ncbi:ABC transporter ATP-binding protein [Candidatus Kaiserbacteria bacterium]|nr:ABC transporter ATP-binding protein [Candidatus Kaiserbacteria bacterium]